MIEQPRDLPEGFVPVMNLMQLYKLRKGKRKESPENMIRDNAQVVYIYSELKEKYYRRKLLVEIEDRTLQYYIARRLLYYKPKE